MSCAAVRRSPATAQPCALCRPRSRHFRRLWRSRSSVRHVVRPDVRRVLCRMPCALCAACRRSRSRPISQPSGMSPVKGVNLSACLAALPSIFALSSSLVSLRASHTRQISALLPRVPFLSPRANLRFPSGSSDTANLQNVFSAFSLLLPLCHREGLEPSGPIFAAFRRPRLPLLICPAMPNLSAYLRNPCSSDCITFCKSGVSRCPSAP